MSLNWPFQNMIHFYIFINTFIFISLILFYLIFMSLFLKLLELFIMA